MHPADRKMFLTYITQVENLSGRLLELSADLVKKEREVAREIRHVVEDLDYVSTDFRDTVQRIE